MICECIHCIRRFVLSKSTKIIKTLTTIDLKDNFNQTNSITNYKNSYDNNIANLLMYYLVLSSSSAPPIGNFSHREMRLCGMFDFSLEVKLFLVSSLIFRKNVSAVWMVFATCFERFQPYFKILLRIQNIISLLPEAN